jgi:putative transposase
VKRNAVGDIYVYLVCEVQSIPVEARTGKSVGFDFGLKKFLTGSDGYDIKSPDFFMQNAKIIRTKSRRLSSKQKGSHKRERARLDLARAYRKMENQRRDFHFKTAQRLCEEYALISLETLNMKYMARKYGRKVHSLGFSEFVKILEYEAQKFGTQIVFIDPWYASSQICNNCGYKNPELKDLRIREWDCPECGEHHDRDRNAAKNIERVGASTHRGDEVSPEQSGICRRN